MKKFLIILFVVSIAMSAFVSCGEKYEDPTGSLYQGTWVLVNGDTTAQSPVFMHIRDLEGEKIMLFYISGRYDSSFVYREEVDRKDEGSTNVYVRRIWDIDTIVNTYKVTDAEGTPIKNSKGGDSIFYEKVLGPLKPLAIDSTLREKYYGTYSFDATASPVKMHMKQYATNSDDKPIIDKNPPLATQEYERPK